MKFIQTICGIKKHKLELAGYTTIQHIPNLDKILCVEMFGSELFVWILHFSTEPIVGRPTPKPGSSVFFVVNDEKEFHYDPKMKYFGSAVSPYAHINYHVFVNK
jgi:hypothetical protein